MKRSLTDFNLFYTLMFPLVQFATFCHYRRIVVRGKENIPQDQRYILAPCHQNAMMDPLVVLMAMYKPIVFLARADIFANPVARFFLTWLRISPVYRIRDGRDQLTRNEAVFDNARQALEKGMPLCLMAEGTHNNRHQLLPLVKGMFRIAGETQRDLADKPLYIVPVGLDYDHYENPYSSVVVNFCKPIDVRQYMAEYADNEPMALNHMRQDLTLAMKDAIHQVNADEHYDDEYAYCHLKTADNLKSLHLRNNVWGRFMARRHISRQLAQLNSDSLAPIYAEGAAFASKCEAKRVPLWFASKCLGVPNWLLALRWFLGLIGLLLLLFLCRDMLLLWLLSNPVVYLPTHLIAKAKVKDPQFRSSINYGIRFALTMVYVITLFVVEICTCGLWRAVGLLLLGLLSAWLTPKIIVFLRDLLYGYRWLRRK
ncbi:MAG: 1-acyl-sn-glycerol-3-phosphate acyltransferase [Bacteroidales bacterium]|nr:1-acyl-sn-glycerol-3-phosphate acyltransferase [Bacteroidales bacterium]